MPIPPGLKTFSVHISEDLSERLHIYISKTWPAETHGKLRQVVEEAIKQYLDTKEAEKKSRDDEGGEGEG